MLANELTRYEETTLRAQLLRMWNVMQECVEIGCTREGPTLPGGLQVRRRAPGAAPAAADPGASRSAHYPFGAIEWVNLYALAVNEENASGGRIATAPTNGAAGIVPAVLHYYTRFFDDIDDDAVIEFLLTTAAIGVL